MLRSDLRAVVVRDAHVRRQGCAAREAAAQSVRRGSRDVSSRTEKRSHISRIVRRHSLASEGNALPVRGDGDAWPDRRRAMRDRRAGSRNASADGEVRWNIPVPRRRRARRVVQTLQSGVGAGAAVDPGRLRNGSSASDGVRGAGDRDRKYRRRGFVQRRRRRFHRSDPRCRCDTRKDSRAVRKSSRCASRWAKRRSRA